MRSIAACIAAVGLVASLAGPVAAERPVEYLALGDSLAFGFSPLVAPTDTEGFVSYADDVAAALRDDLTNAACPGETSSHFVDLLGTDNNCGQWRFDYGLPLHADYDGTQLAFLDEFLATHPKTQLVTIDIGANDLFALQKGCSYQPQCILAGLPGLLGGISANLDTIYRHIREVDGYRHKLVALTFYARDYTDTTTAGVAMQVNQVLTDRTLAWGGIVADGFGAFAAASAPFGGDTCAAGLRIVTGTSPLTCDDHPSPAGHALLARAILDVLRSD